MAAPRFVHELPTALEAARGPHAVMGMSQPRVQTPYEGGTCSHRNALMCGTCNGGTCKAETTPASHGTRCNTPGVVSQGTRCNAGVGECEAATCQNEGMHTCSDSNKVDEDVESPSAPARPGGDSCEHDVDGCGGRPCMDNDCTLVLLLCRLEWSQLRYQCRKARGRASGRLQGVNNLHALGCARRRKIRHTGGSRASCASPTSTSARLRSGLPERGHCSDSRLTDIDECEAAPGAARTRALLRL